jgi:hypothetical protein
LGFRVYREVDGHKVLVSPDLIAGTALLSGSGVSLVADRSYSWWDGPANPGTRYWIEELDTGGANSYYGPVIAAQASAAQASAAGKKNSPLLHSLSAAGQHRILQQPAGLVRTAQAAVASSPVDLMGKRAIELGITQPGWYAVALSTLAANGLQVGNGKNLRLYAEGVEQALEIKGGAVQFYGTGLDTPSTATRVYWLVNGGGSKDYIATAPTGSGASAGADFLASVEQEDRSIYDPSADAANGIDFFGDLISSTPDTETLSAVDLSRSDNATLAVSLQAVSSGAHEVSVALNGVTLGAVTWTGSGLGTASFPASSIITGTNTVTLTASSSEDFSLVANLTLNYERTYTAANDALEFTVNGGEQVTVGGFSNAQVRMVDITDQAAPIELTVSATAQVAGSFSATAAGSGMRTIYAFGADQVAVPASISLHQPARLTPLRGRVDTIVITTSALMGAVQPLIAHRESQRLHVTAVDIAEVYDGFNFGEKSPQAIKSFLAATQSAKQAPHYVLLVGSASYDPRNFLDNNPDPDLVPTGLINTDQFQAASDGWFGDFANSGESTLAIGRLPAQTAAEVSTLVTKIIAYDSLPKGSGYLLASDASDPGVTPTFTDNSTSLTALLPAGATPTMITRAADNSNRPQLLTDLGSNPDLINYIGHGNINLWGGSWLTDSDASALTGNGHPAFAALMTCLNGFFIDPQLPSVAESLLETTSGGAVAVWASSGVTVPAGQLQANQALYTLLFGSTTPPRLGEAVRQAQNASSDPDVRQTWNLLGDPETQLR